VASDSGLMPSKGRKAKRLKGKTSLPLCPFTYSPFHVFTAVMPLVGFLCLNFKESPDYYILRALIALLMGIETMPSKILK